MNTPSLEYRRFCREAKAQLIAAHRWSREHDNTPETTVEILTDSIGKESAAEIVAVMVLCRGDWDARISSDSRAWAAETCSHEVKELDQIAGLYYCDEIHPTHMEQIVWAMRRA